MGTTRGLERLIFFTDAVVAIAITLLILPLVDPVAEFARQQDSVSAFLAANLPQLASFFISFVVIAQLWTSHHAIFEHVRAYTRPLMFLSLFWALTVVFLPLPTSITAEFTPSPESVALYIGTMTLSSLSLTTMAVIIHRHPVVEAKDHPMADLMPQRSTVASAAFLVALVIGVTVPAINYFALLLLFLTTPVSAFVVSRTERSQRAASRR